MVSNYVISTIRTYVPILVGLLLTWLASSLHVVIDPSSQAGLVALCVAVVSAAYYALVRLLEHHWPSLGVLLGVPAKPTYAAALSAPSPSLSPTPAHQSPAPPAASPAPDQATAFRQSSKPPTS